MMPGFLLDIGSVVLCAHGGLGQPTAPAPRVKIMGKPVVVKTTTYAIAGCAYQQPPPKPSPCITAANWAKEAQKVTVMGVAVLLADSKATCTPNGVSTLVIPVQARVKGK
ncbi:hypothetical protein A7982_13827 [Minicystis rosea]|nr:hypothetical protein A7982_13827 [Minicystis rosea]